MKMSEGGALAVHHHQQQQQQGPDVAVAVLLPVVFDYKRCVLQPAAPCMYADVMCAAWGVHLLPRY
jgi:hypothetical protein